MIVISDSLVVVGEFLRSRRWGWMGTGWEWVVWKRTLLGWVTLLGFQGQVAGRSCCGRLPFAIIRGRPSSTVVWVVSVPSDPAVRPSV
jgi:hypothetical protein